MAVKEDHHCTPAGLVGPSSCYLIFAKTYELCHLVVPLNDRHLSVILWGEAL